MAKRSIEETFQADQAEGAKGNSEPADDRRRA